MKASRDTRAPSSMLELWTWGYLKATLHRVKNISARDRLSFPLFYDPNWQCSLERIPKGQLAVQLPEEVGAQQRWDAIDLAKLGRDTTYGQFVWRI